MSSLTLTLGTKNRGKKNNLKERIENRKKMRKKLSPLSYSSDKSMVLNLGWFDGKVIATDNNITAVLA